MMTGRLMKEEWPAWKVGNLEPHLNDFNKSISSADDHALLLFQQGRII